MNFLKKNKNLFYFIIFFFIIIFIYFYYNFFLKYSYFKVPVYNSLHYKILKNKGGIDIPNQNKKGLHLSYNENSIFKVKKNFNLIFSIQVASNENFNIINKKKNNMIVNGNPIFLEDNLFVQQVETSIGVQYLLLFKNFQNRKNALIYCDKYSYLFDKCIIVNVKNLD